MVGTVVVAVVYWYSDVMVGVDVVAPAVQRKCKQWCQWLYW
jgi:hypothetical protein